MNSDLRAALTRLDCASLADVNKSLRVMDAGLRPVADGGKIVGTARTVRCHEDFLAVIGALAEAREGEVLVIDTGGSRRAVVGELFSMEAERRGLAGIVVDGAVRDIATIRELGVPVWARSFNPCSGTTQAVGETQIPVTVGGVNVEPGEIVLADDDGIIVANETELSAVLADAQRIERTEAQVREAMMHGTSLMDMLNANAHIAAVRRGEESRLGFTIDG